MIGISLIPFTRKVILSKFINKNKKKYKSENNKITDGDYEDISDDNDKKYEISAVYTRSFSWDSKCWNILHGREYMGVFLGINIKIKH